MNLKLSLVKIWISIYIQSLVFVCAISHSIRQCFGTSRATQQQWLVQALYLKWLVKRFLWEFQFILADKIIFFCMGATLKLNLCNLVSTKWVKTPIQSFLILPLSCQNQTRFPSVSSTCKIYSVLNKWWWLSSSKLGRVKGHTCYQTVLFWKACTEKTWVHPGEFQQCNQSLAAVVMTLLYWSIGKAIPENYAPKIL